MPYSITTQDGITIDNIPDDVPADAPALKERVAKIRGQSPARPTGASAPSSGFVMGLRDPIDAGAQILRRIVPEGIGEAVDNFGNKLADMGLPVARSNGVAGVDKVVNDVNTEYERGRNQRAQGVSQLVTQAPVDPGFDWGRLGGNILNPVNALFAPAGGAATVGRLALTGAKAGAIGGVLQPVLGDTEDFALQKGQQAVLGALAGGIATPVIGKATQGIARGIARQQARQPINVEVAVNNIIRQQGVSPSEVTDELLAGVRRQVEESVQAGRRLDPAAAVRRARFEALGMTGESGPTVGQLTRDPIQFAQERNLSGVVLNTPQGQGNPLATRFQNQNAQLQNVVGETGAGGAVDRVSYGQQLLDVLNAANRTADDNVRAAYTAFRESTGRDLEVPLQGLAQDYAATLRDFGDTIPAAIRNQFEELGLMTGTQRRVLNIEDAERLIKTINKHYDPRNKAQRLALDDLRGAVQRSIVSAADAAPDGAAAEAASLANEARQTAASVFRAREQAPALAAAVNNEAPDKLFQRYLMNAPVREVEALAPHIQQNPELWQQTRAQVGEILQRAAFGENVAGDNIFSPARFAATLRNIGPQRLAVFFTPEEVARLNMAAQVASDINSVPAGAKNAVNYSGTGAAVMNLLGKLSESSFLRGIPGARSLANSVGEIRTEAQINQALSGQPPVQAPEVPPEVLRALQGLLPLAGTAAGSSTGVLSR